LQHEESEDVTVEIAPSHTISAITAAHPIGPLIFIGRAAFISSEMFIRPRQPRCFA
jgi:hypothetical protein